MLVLHAGVIGGEGERCMQVRFGVQAGSQGRPNPKPFSRQRTSPSLPSEMKAEDSACGL